MKKIITLLLAVVLLAGCVGKPEGVTPDDTKPQEEPQKEEQIVEHDYVSAFGYNTDLDKANYEFLDFEKDWAGFFMDPYNEAEGYVEWGISDNMYVNEDNWKEYSEHGYPPVASYKAWFENGKSGRITRFVARIPNQDPTRVDDYQAEKLQKYQHLILKGIFPQLSDDQVDEIIAKVGLPSEDDYAVYRSGSKNPADFIGGTVEVYPDNTDSKPYKVSTSYSAEYGTIILTIE